jgi:hypothetical protein
MRDGQIAEPHYRWRRARDVVALLEAAESKKASQEGVAQIAPRHRLATTARGGVQVGNRQGRKVMSKKSKRIAMILVGVVIALLAVAQHFGWITGPPPLLAPGIQ